MLMAIDGRPRVLAFVKAWDPEAAGPTELAAIRAQLRGLGAVLVIVSEVGAWSFAPDDDLERFEVRRAALDREIEETAETYGIEPSCDAVIIVDGHGAVWFSHVVNGPLPTTLDLALDAAGAAMLATPRSRITFNRREWALTSLCAGFALVLLGCKGKAQQEASPPPATVSAVPPPTEYDAVLARSLRRAPARRSR